MKRKGFSVTEVALSFLIVLLAALPLLTLISGTHRRAHDVSTSFKEAVLAQLVLEALKARVELNPCFMRELSRAYGFVEQGWKLASGEVVKAQVLTASVWDEEPPTRDAQGTPASAGLFTQHLFNHSGGGLYSAENARSLSPAASAVLSSRELDSLRQNYRGLVYRVVVADGPFLRTGGGPLVPAQRRDFTRQVRVEVFSAEPGGGLPAVPAFAVETILETPEQSLSVASLLERQAEREDETFSTERAQAFFAVSWSAPPEVPPQVVQSLADLSVMFSQVVGESLNSDGEVLGFPVTSPAKSIASWITTLSSTGSVFGKQQSAQLAERRAELIMDALYRTRQPIAELFDATDDVTGRGLALLARLETSSAPGLLEETVQFIKIPLFWINFFEDQSYRRALEQPTVWHARFGAALAQAARIREELDSDRRATPLERLRNLRSYVDLTRALKLRAGGPVPQEALLASTRRAYLDTLMPFSEWLSQDDVNDLPSLTERYPRYASAMRELASLADETGKYKRMLANFQRELPELVRRLSARLSAAGQAQRLSDLTRRTRLQVADRLKEQTALTAPPGAPTGALALRDIFQRSLTATTPGSVAALQSELLALEKGQALMPPMEAEMARAVQRSLDKRLDRMVAGDLRALAVPTAP